MDINVEALQQRYNPDVCIAYGSGAISQNGYSPQDKPPQIDFIFGVEDPLAWHKENMRRNWRDYALVPWLLGARFVSSLQERGAGIWYHPFVPFEEREIKYGVIQTDRLVRDLSNWDSLYLAGRLHKPVEVVTSTPAVNDAIEANLESAVNTALLLLGRRTSKRDLYLTIAGLSYKGDVRNGYAENPQKVQNIVDKSMALFDEMYGPLLEAHPTVQIVQDQIVQDMTLESRRHIYQRLPESLRVPVDIDSGDMTPIREQIKRLNKASSKAQAIKGLVSAGLWNSAKYLLEKRKKLFKK